MKSFNARMLKILIEELGRSTDLNKIIRMTVADELLIAHKLKDKKIITQQEFEKLWGWVTVESNRLE